MPPWPEHATGHRRSRGRSGPRNRGRPRLDSWLMLVMPLGQVGFAGREALAEKGIDLIQAGNRRPRLDDADDDLDLRLLGEFQRFGGVERAVLVDSMNHFRHPIAPCRWWFRNSSSFRRGT